MKIMIKEIQLLRWILILQLCRSAKSFTGLPSFKPNKEIQHSRVQNGLFMVGGRGWGNEDYLDSLGGSEEDRNEANDAYQNFKASRDAFNKRQMERMNTPQMQKFMQQQQQLQRQEQNQEDSDEFAFYQNSSNSAPNRFQEMMEQAQRKKMMGRGGGTNFDGPFGFQQKLAVPLEPDDDIDDIDQD